MRLQVLKRTQETISDLTSDLQQEQDEDEEVQRWMCQQNPSRVIKRYGVLLRKCKPREDNQQEYEQIMLPCSYRQRVLKMAHSIPMAGHLGQDKIARQILRHFFWPTVNKDVNYYCQKVPRLPVDSYKRTAASTNGIFTNHGRTI